MATTAAPTRISPHATVHPESSHSGIWGWITTVDHKRIGILYLYTALTFFIIGGLEAVIIRAQLQGPNGQLV